MPLIQRNFLAWQQGEIDDATFERRQIALAWKWTLLSFGLLALVAVVLMLANGATLMKAFGMVALLGVFGLVAGHYIADVARFQSRNQVIERRRKQVEADPAAPLVAHPTASDIRQFFGPHRRSWRYACTLLLFALVLAAIIAWLALKNTEISEGIVLVGIGYVFLTCWGLYWLLDRRIYLDISAEGVWCRRWGPSRVGFDQFKAVYPRRNGILVGVVLVPQNTAELRRQLSWVGRLALRSGDFGGVAAHVDTLTIWTNRVDLPQHGFLVAMQAAILRQPRPSGLTRTT